jgi:creatinine amidohydrolase
LARATWPDVERGSWLLVVPVGSCEQHGPHLPLDTDLRIATALAESLANRRADVALAPGLPFGASGEHADFPGTLSIGQAALEMVLVELVRSADRFRGVVIVNGHGGNAEAVNRAAATLDAEGRAVLVWSPRVEGGDAHAGRTETSLMLGLAADLVRLDRAEAGAPEPLDELLPVLRQTGVRAVSPTGVLGDPAGASADEGRAILAVLESELFAAVARWEEGHAR